MTTEAVIVSTARTGVGKAYRGALNNTEGPTLAGHGRSVGVVESAAIGLADAGARRGNDDSFSRHACLSI